MAIESSMTTGPFIGTEGIGASLSAHRVGNILTIRAGAGDQRTRFLISLFGGPLLNLILWIRRRHLSDAPMLVLLMLGFMSLGCWIALFSLLRDLLTGGRRIEISRPDGVISLFNERKVLFLKIVPKEISTLDFRTARYSPSSGSVASDSVDNYVFFARTVEGRTIDLCATSRAQDVADIKSFVNGFR